MGNHNDKENIYHFSDIFRGKLRFDENCAAMAKLKLQNISNYDSHRKPRKLVELKRWSRWDCSGTEHVSVQILIKQVFQRISRVSA